MPPQKAIIIVLILFFILAVTFAVLYVNNQPADNSNDNIQAGSTGQEKLSPEEQKIKDIETKTSQQIEQIVEQGKTTSDGLTVEAGQKIIEAETQELLEKLKLRTPEQLKADQERKAELEKIRQQEILQVKEQLQDK